MSDPVPLKVNDYWGRRAGMLWMKNKDYFPQGENIFKIKRGCQSTTDNRGPTGWKLRRAPRRYRNVKLTRKYGVG